MGSSSEGFDIGIMRLHDRHGGHERRARQSESRRLKKSVPAMGVS
jgi:hypothetical protein